MSSEAKHDTVVDAHPKRLRQQRSFMLLWAGQSVSMLGTSVSTVAIPLVAVVSLHASPFEVGMLSFLQTLPFLLLSLFIGVLVDRVRRRPLLITADFGRTVAIGLIPVLTFADVLNIGSLYLCVLAAGILTVVFDLAYFAYTPLLLPEELLLTGNSRLELSNQTAGLLGPGIAGVAITIIRIPFVVTLDAISYLVSAVSLLMIRTPETRPHPLDKPHPRRVLREIGEGTRALFSNPYLRPVALNATAYNLSAQMILTLFVLYATRDLHLAPGWIGLIFAVGSLGGVAGSAAIRRVVDRFRFGPTFIATMAIVRVALPLVAVVGGPKPVLICGFAAIWFVTLFGLVASNACVMTLRQVAVSNELRGRMNAAYRTVSFGAIPLGALLAGVLASSIHVYPTIVVAAILVPLSILFVIFSPVARMNKATDAAPRAA
jgi:MFS family permease